MCECKCKVIQCYKCKRWQTGIAHAITGKCKLDGQIKHKYFYCADGEEKCTKN